jgi:Fe(3+) dicitrate transport protein
VKKAVLISLNLCLGFISFSQEMPAVDTPVHRYMPEITVVGRGSKSDYQQMPEIVGTNIYAGKKNALIVLENVQGNIANNTMRQVLAKVPGIHIWESEPGGIQIGIAARGLSPNRSWEFNVRQNGYDIAADPFGYPEAYYNPQLQAVQRIEIVRGAGSLQYGPQFGGLVNYILKNGSEINRKIEFETQQTFGSDAMFNSYNALGGKTGKLHYYTFLDHRNGNGWRDNSRFYSNAGFGTVTYNLNPKLSLGVEAMYSHTRSQQPGGLTDPQIDENARNSLRSRNWFDIKWTTPALTLNYRFSDKTRWVTKAFGTIGDRNSVGFLQPVTVKDSINPATGEYNRREVLIDQYRNYGIESRLITGHRLASLENILSAGIRVYTGSTRRRSSANGSTGSDYDMSISGSFSRDIDFQSDNAAAFLENVIHVGRKMLLIPGIRYEWLQAEASGFNNTVNGIPQFLQNVKRSRSFLLFGAGAEFHITQGTEFYANYTQAYRPIQFASLQAPPTTDVIDPNLKDSRGYNLDLGYRGRAGNFLQFDASVYLLQYNNRVGTVIVSNPQGTTPSTYRLVTNVGASSSKGVEAYVEFNAAKAFFSQAAADLLLFASYSFTDAKYSGDHKDANTKNKRVENAPRNIGRAGLTLGYKKFLLTPQVSYVGDSYSDANNTVLYSSNGNTGLIPSYTMYLMKGTSRVGQGVIRDREHCLAMGEVGS